MGYVEDLNDARTKHGTRRVSTRLGWAGEKSDFFSILLQIQLQELVIFCWEIEAGPIAGETRNDAAMFLTESGRFKSLTKVSPPRRHIGGKTCALRRR